ncbi:MAG TPA: hypothetical protein VH370_21340 [Humisphaera sp.]|jgi:hypothetical protein|nr:hypothetical protein [Humisphaera sp.]
MKLNRILWSCVLICNLHAFVHAQDIDLLKKELAAIKPGMTYAEATALLKQRLPDQAQPLGQDRNEEWTGRVDVGEGVYLLLRVKHMKAPKSHILPEDMITDVSFISFDDFRPSMTTKLFPLVRLIHLSSSWGDSFDPAALVRAVNGLRLAGKDTALQAMRVYAGLGGPESEQAWKYNIDDQRVFLVVRLLFERKDGNAMMPRPILGQISPDIRPNPKDWPLFPLVVVDDIPFCLCRGYTLAGVPEDPSQHLKYYEKNCEIRAQRLSPRISPLTAVDQLCESDSWRRVFLDDTAGADTREMLRIQAVRSVSNLLGAMPNTRRFNGALGEKTWNAYRSDERLSLLAWDDEKQCFLKRASPPH